MLVNLTDVLTSEGRMITMEARMEKDTVENRLGVFPVSEKSPVSFTFTNLGTGKALIAGKMRLQLTMRCDRCLCPVEVPFELDFERVVYSPADAGLTSSAGLSYSGGYKEAESTEADDPINEEEQKLFMEGYQLNVETLIDNELALNWPMKVLCRPDCRGICGQCGKDLNTGECGCDTFVPDPRMAAIKDIFYTDKEV